MTYEIVPQSPPARTIGVAEMAQRLNICEPTVYQMLKDGKIPAMRVGKRWLISRTRYEQWEASFGETEA